MEFRLRFYRTSDGRCPVLEFIEEQRRLNPVLFRQTVAAIRKMQDSRNHGGELSQPIDGWRELFEIRPDGARVLFIFRGGRLIVLLSAVLKKRNRLPRSVFKLADTYRIDYLKRCTGDEHESNETI